MKSTWRIIRNNTKTKEQDVDLWTDINCVFDGNLKRVEEAIEAMANDVQALTCLIHKQRILITRMFDELKK